MRHEDRTAEDVRLEEHVFSVKKRFLAMYKKAHAGHVGSSLTRRRKLIYPLRAYSLFVALRLGQALIPGSFQGRKTLDGKTRRPRLQ